MHILEKRIRMRGGSMAFWSGMPGLIAMPHVVFGLGGLDGSSPLRPNVAYGLDGIGVWLCLAVA